MMIVEHPASLRAGKEMRTPQAPCGARWGVPWRPSCRHSPDVGNNIDAARRLVCRRVPPGLKWTFSRGPHAATRARCNHAQAVRVQKGVEACARRR